MDIEKVQALGREELSQLQSGDYILAVTKDRAYVDEFESYVWRQGSYDIYLGDGVLDENGHSCLRINENDEGLKFPNDVEEFYAVDKELVDESFTANSLTDVLNQLNPKK